jgi:hypothetical protein
VVSFNPPPPSRFTVVQNVVGARLIPSLSRPQPGSDAVIKDNKPRNIRQGTAILARFPHNLTFANCASNVRIVWGSSHLGAEMSGACLAE